MTEYKYIMSGSTGSHHGYKDDIVRENDKMCSKQSPQVAKLLGPSPKQESKGTRQKLSNASLSDPQTPKRGHLPNRQNDEPLIRMSNSFPHPYSSVAQRPLCAISLPS